MDQLLNSNIIKTENNEEEDYTTHWGITDMSNSSGKPGNDLSSAYQQSLDHTPVNLGDKNEPVTKSTIKTETNEDASCNELVITARDIRSSRQRKCKEKVAMVGYYNEMVDTSESTSPTCSLEGTASTPKIKTGKKLVVKRKVETDYVSKIKKEVDLEMNEIKNPVINHDEFNAYVHLEKLPIQEDDLLHKKKKRKKKRDDENVNIPKESETKSKLNHPKTQVKKIKRETGIGNEMVADHEKASLIEKDNDTKETSQMDDTEEKASRKGDQRTKPFFKCPHCEKFIHTGSKAQHMKTHIDERPFKCDICSKGFKSSGNLREHRIIHSDVRPFSCSICQKGCSTKADLAVHMKIHTGEKGHTCDICGKAFTQKGNLTRHALTHVIYDMKMKCQECGKVSLSKTEFQDHIRSHISGELPYQCGNCGKCFPDQQTRNEHKIQVHDVLKPFACNLCGKGFTQKAHLDRHLLLHNGEKPFKCDMCGKAFAYKHHLSRHILSHTGEKPYKCEKCGMRFQYSQMFKLHVQVQCEQKEKPQQPNNKDCKEHGKNCTRIHCPRCGKSFLTIANYRVHLRNVHKGRFICKCGQKFSQKLLFERHKEKHERYQHQCSTCFKFFDTETKLKTHKKNNHGTLPYICDNCGKGFCEKSRLKKHIDIVHTQSFSHTCNTCGKVFNSARYLKRHIQYQHDHSLIKSKKCPVCSKAYTAFKLKLHLSRMNHYPASASERERINAWIKLELEASDNTKKVRDKDHELKAKKKSPSKQSGNTLDKCANRTRIKKRKSNIVLPKQVDNDEKSEQQTNVNTEMNLEDVDGDDGKTKKIIIKALSQMETENAIPAKIELSPVKCDDCGKEFSNEPNFKAHRLYTCIKKM